jgi:hypothetical protein
MYLWRTRGLFRTRTEEVTQTYKLSKLSTIFTDSSPNCLNEKGVNRQTGTRFSIFGIVTAIDLLKNVRPQVIFSPGGDAFVRSSEYDLYQLARRTPGR